MAGESRHPVTSTIEVASLVLYASDRRRTAAFYRTLGLDLVDERHDGGPEHSVTNLGSVHFAVYQADRPDPAQPPPWHQPGCSFPGVWVEDLEATTGALRSAGHPVLLDHETRSWGCRTVVADPDGRPIELNQRDHCAA